jgi:hypothetical protein
MTHAARIENEMKLSPEIEVLMRFVFSLKDKLQPDVWQKVEEARQQLTDEYLNKRCAQRG